MPTQSSDILFSTDLQVFAFTTILKQLWFPTTAKPGLGGTGGSSPSPAAELPQHFTLEQGTILQTMS